MKEIYIFWHVANLHTGLSIAQEQLDYIKSSGLYKAAKKIFIGLAGEKTDYISSILNDKIELLSITSLSDLEIPTSRKMIEFSKTLKEDAYILYIHTKGCSKYNQNIYTNGQAWRKYMEYFTIEKWKTCIEKLNHGYESCGTEIHTDPLVGIHYSGAFFWIKSNILKNININNINMNSHWGKYSTEAIPSMIKHKMFGFFSYRSLYPNFDMYTSTVEPKVYRILD